MSIEEKKSLSQIYLSRLSTREKNILYEELCVTLSEKLDYLLDKLEIK